MKRSSVFFVIFVIAFVFIVASCGTGRQAMRLKKLQPHVGLSLADEQDFIPEIDTNAGPRNDTLIVKDLSGNDVFLMRTIKDATGEETASERLAAAVVTARFRNVAERNGKVDIRFKITVPPVMMNDNWQLRFYPRMAILGDTLALDKLIITGSAYRHAQLRGYQQYERWLSRIVNDSTRFIDIRNLEIFLERNLPEIYYFKNDTSYVSDEQFKSVFGVTEEQAINHYTNHIAKKLNEWRKSRRDLMFRRFVKVPIDNQHVRLDTIVTMSDGGFEYEYVQTIKTRPKLRKVDILLNGEIYEQDELKYIVPDIDPLTFYISSVSAFVENITRYKTKVIERRVDANDSYYITFPVGRSDINPTLGENEYELNLVRSNIRRIMKGDEFVLDSVSVSAFASPEGSISFNNNLSAKRAASAAQYFSRYVIHVRDSLKAERGMSISFDGSDEKIQKQDVVTRVPFTSRSGGENWNELDRLVSVSERLTPEQKESYEAICRSHTLLDPRESHLKNESYYKYMRDSLYPALRVVNFKFVMHRKGMVKDTIHTTEIDSTYLEGIALLRDRDYDAALDRLVTYADINTAIAYLSLDRNENARVILETLPDEPKVNYMLAFVYARKGEVHKAVQLYMRSCEQDRTYVSRGNLDPEISALIRDYGLNKQDDDEFGDLGF